MVRDQSPLHLRFRRTFIYRFIVTNMKIPVIGADSLAHSGLLPAPLNRRYYIGIYHSVSFKQHSPHFYQISRNSAAKCYSKNVIEYIEQNM